jgi:hypothetical protein
MELELYSDTVQVSFGHKFNNTRGFDFAEYGTEINVAAVD